MYKYTYLKILYVCRITCIGILCVFGIRGGSHLIQGIKTWLTKLFNIILRMTKIPDSWRFSYLVPFCKNKDVTQRASNR